MATIFESACLAGHIYHDPKIHVPLTVSVRYKGDPLKDGGWVTYPDAIPFNEASHFFAGLYIKFQNGEPMEQVLAIRGTQSAIDGLVDVISWCDEVLGDGKHDHTILYMSEAVAAANSARNYVQHYFPSLHPLGMTYTGHSLGGAIAKCLSFRNVRTHVAAFNAPGCGHLPDADLERHGYIQNINARYGFINKIGETVGHLHMVDIPNDETQAKSMFKAFDAKDYEAGKFHYEEELRLEGDVDTLKSLVPAAITPAVKKLAHQQLLQCEKTADKESWLHLSRYIDESVCHSLLATDIDVIKAQHSIANMIHALQKLEFAETALP